MKRTTAHHVRTGEHQRMGEQPFEEACLCRCSTSPKPRAVRCSSRVRDACGVMTDGVPSPAGFRHCLKGGFGRVHEFARKRPAHSRHLSRLKEKHGNDREQPSLSFLGISLYGGRLVLRAPTGLWSEMLEPRRCRARDRAWDDGHWDGAHARTCWSLSS